MIRAFWAFWLLSIPLPALAEPVLQFSGRYLWSDDAEWFGGWSGLEMLDHGGAMVAISDRGWLLRARVDREDGRIGGIVTLAQTPIGPADSPVEARDSEGLAITQDGRAFVSFEHQHRLMRMAVEDGALRDPVAPPVALPLNAGIEALAVSAQGVLYALSEMRPHRDAPLVLYAYDAPGWRVAARLPHRRPFLPVAADFDDRGRLWLLERAATLLGFRSRIRLFDLSTQPPTEHVLLTTPPGHFDNLEGLAVWRTRDGTLRLTAVSDDNFLRVQRTEIIEFTVDE